MTAAGLREKSCSQAAAHGHASFTESLGGKRSLENMVETLSWHLSLPEILFYSLVHFLSPAPEHKLCEGRDLLWLTQRRILST